jgi:phage terminase small subunit
MAIKKLVKPPSHLKEAGAGARLWTAVQREYPINESSGQVLAQGCEALDRLRQIQAKLKKDGLTFVDKFSQIKPHPLLVAEGSTRTQFVRCMRLLNLNLSEFLDESTDEDSE